MIQLTALFIKWLNALKSVLFARLYSFEVLNNSSLLDMVSLLVPKLLSLEPPKSANTDLVDSTAALAPRGAQFVPVPDLRLLDLGKPESFA